MADAEYIGDGAPWSCLSFVCDYVYTDAERCAVCGGRPKIAKKSGRAFKYCG